MRVARRPLIRINGPFMMSSVIRRVCVIASLVGSVALAGFSPIISASAAPAVTRPSDPVVLTGADAPSLIGRTPTRIIGLRWTGSAWQRRHVQVDERAVVNFARIYGVLNAPTTSFYGSQPGLVNELVYTSGSTWTGNDPDRLIDANDEIAFMARDGGLIATGAPQPSGTAAGSGVEVRIIDPLVPGSESYLYLFQKGTTGILPGGAGPRYGSYKFRLLSGSYKSTYSRFGSANPEDTLFKSSTYTRHFSDRWLNDQIKITAPGASGVDILDRQKALFAPNTCGRSENTFNATGVYGSAEGAFIVNKNGPVRSIRSYVGANSGPNTQRTHVFYDRREDIVTDLRVHSIGSIMDFFDYSPAASGMTYRDSLNQGGVTVDGVPDSLNTGEAAWEQLAGSQGTITHVNNLATSFARTNTHYYLDDSTPSDTQCTGDAFAYGSSGGYITSAIPCTDPGTGCSATLSNKRIIYYDAPGGDAVTALAYRSGVDTPVAATATTWSP